MSRPPAGRPWRVVIFSTVGPAVLGFDAILRAAGHEPVAVLTPRLPEDADPRRREFYAGIVEGAPAGLDLCLVPSKDRLPRLVAAYEPDLGLCMGYPWRLPREVLEIPRLGVLNGHPSLLPRHRGPIPMAWAIREGDAELGMTYHLMDEEFDTGPTLARGSRPLPPDAWFDDLRPLFPELVAELLPKALARLAAGERGDPQPEDGATYAGLFEPDYLRVRGLVEAGAGDPHAGAGVVARVRVPPGRARPDRRAGRGARAAAPHEPRRGRRRAPCRMRRRAAPDRRDRAGVARLRCHIRLKGQTPGHGSRGHV